MKKIFSICLSVVLSVFMLSTVVYAENSNIFENPYTITEAYVYDALPGTAEWKLLENTADKRKACYVPEDIVKEMSTEALVETVVQYPLFPDVYAYNSLQDGLMAVSQYFPGISELLARDDAFFYLKKYANIESARTEDTDISYYNADFLIQYFENSEVDDMPASFTATSTYVYTPKGTPVPAYYNLTWTDWGTSYTAAKAQITALMGIYTSATLDAPVDASYNCHSYAWYSQSTANKYWINSPNAYISDGSYKSTTPMAGARITYYDTSSGIYTHSGIIVNSGTTPSAMRVCSKWGSLGLMTHDADDCPYYESNTTIQYWKAN